MARRAFDHRLVIRDARLLRRLRNAVDVGAQRDHRLARSPRRHERGRNAGDAFLHAEAVLLEDVDQVAVGLELLKSELAVAEDLVDHLLRHLLPRLHVGDRFLLERVEPGVAFGGCRAASARSSGASGTTATLAAHDERERSQDRLRIDMHRPPRQYARRHGGASSAVQIIVAAVP